MVIDGSEINIGIPIVLITRQITTNKNCGLDFKTRMEVIVAHGNY